MGPLINGSYGNGHCVRDGWGPTRVNYRARRAQRPLLTRVREAIEDTTCGAWRRRRR
jgi:hypothetical protein